MCSLRIKYSALVPGPTPASACSFSAASWRGARRSVAEARGGGTRGPGKQQPGAATLRQTPPRGVATRIGTTCRIGTFHFFFSPQRCLRVLLQGPRGNVLRVTLGVCGVDGSVGNVEGVPADNGSWMGLDVQCSYPAGVGCGVFGRRLGQAMGLLRSCGGQACRAFRQPWHRGEMR